MPSHYPLPFDPIDRAAQLWQDRIGPADTMAAVDAALRPHGLTFARYEALVLLLFSRHGCLPMKVMGQRLQLHPTSVTNIVDRLQADELVERSSHPTDRRTTLVTITEEGLQRQKLATVALTDIDFGLVGLDAERTAALTALLTQVRRAAGDFTDPR